MKTTDSQEAACLSDLIAKIGKLVTVKNIEKAPERLMALLTRIYDLGYEAGIESESLARQNAPIDEDSNE
jgi:hypothetical protein